MTLSKHSGDSSLSPNEPSNSDTIMSAKSTEGEEEEEEEGEEEEKGEEDGG